MKGKDGGVVGEGDGGGKEGRGREEGRLLTAGEGAPVDPRSEVCACLASTTHTLTSEIRNASERV